MSSGIKVDQSVRDAYKKLKTEKKIHYVIFKIEGDKLITLDSEGQEDHTFEDFRNKMIEAGKKGEGRYAVYDVEDAKTGHSRLLFIQWVNDEECKVKSKMLYASSKSNCIKELEGQTKEIQVNEEGDINIENFMEAAFKK